MSEAVAGIGENSAEGRAPSSDGAERVTRTRPDGVANVRTIRENNARAERELASRLEDLARMAGLSASAPGLGGAGAARPDGVASRALRRMAKVCSLPIRSVALEEADASSLPMPERLLETARAEGWRLRRVELAPDVHRRSSPPLLAFRKEDLAPVLLFPDSNGGRLYDAAADEDRVLDERERERLSDRAYCIYETFPREKLTRRNLLRFVFRHSRPALTVVAVAGTLGAMLSLINPLVTEYVTGHVIPMANFGELQQTALLLIVLTACSAVFQLVPTLTMLVFGSQRYERFQSAVFDHCLRLPVNAFRACSAGDMTQRILGAAQIQETVFSVISGQFVGAVFHVVSLAMMFHYSPSLALAGMCFSLLYALGIFLLARLNLRPLAEGVAASGRLSGLLRQFLDGMAKIRTAVAETRVINRCMDEFSTVARTQYTTSRNGSVQSLFSSVFPAVVSLVFYSLVAGPMRGDMDLPAFLAFMSAFQGFQSGMVGVASNAWTLLAIQPDIDRILPILQTEPENVEGGRDPGRLDGRLELSHVTFRYSPDGAKIVDDVSLVAEPGEFVAIVGPSGAGKSTLVRLLLGFERPEKGAVLYSGRDLADLDLRRVRGQLGVILQNAHVLTASILENVLVGTEYTLDDAWEALDRAALGDTVRAMPMGVHTVISPETVSGGQQQRVLLARALVGHPALLILDESTSALDNAAQEEVKRRLDELDATRVVVAHRLSTIVNADRIYVLDGGRIVQTGTYGELVREEGIFRELMARQRTEAVERTA